MSDERFRMSDTYFKRLQSNRPVPQVPLMERRGVYFIWAPAVDLVKVGVTRRGLGKRIAGMSTGSPVDLYAIALIEGAGVAKEAEIHEQIASGRVRGEWFTRDSAWIYARRHLLPNVQVVSRAPFVLRVGSEVLSVELSSGDLAFIPRNGLNKEGSAP